MINMNTGTRISSPEQTARRSPAPDLSQVVLKIGAYLVVVLVLLVCIVPCVWMISTALKEGPEILVSPPYLIPKHFAWENFAAVMRRAPFDRFYIKFKTGPKNMPFYLAL